MCVLLDRERAWSQCVMCIPQNQQFSRYMSNLSGHSQVVRKSCSQLRAYNYVAVAGRLHWESFRSRVETGANMVAGRREHGCLAAMLQVHFEEVWPDLPEARFSGVCEP